MTGVENVIASALRSWRFGPSLYSHTTMDATDTTGVWRVQQQWQCFLLELVLLSGVAKGWVGARAREEERVS